MGWLPCPGQQCTFPYVFAIVHLLLSSIVHYYYYFSNQKSYATSTPVDRNVVIAIRHALRQLVLLHGDSLVLDAEPDTEGGDGEKDEAWVASTVEDEKRDESG